MIQRKDRLVTLTHGYMLFGMRMRLVFLQSTTRSLSDECRGSKLRITVANAAGEKELTVVIGKARCCKGLQNKAKPHGIPCQSESLDEWQHNDRYAQQKAVKANEESAPVS